MGLNEQIAKPLSSEEIQKLIPFSVRVYKYSEIKDFDDINQLLEPYGACIILFETNVIDPNNNKNNAVSKNGPNTKQAIKKRLIKMKEFNEGSWMGHWTCLCRTVDDDGNDSINFFDSYSIIPDDEKKKIDKSFMNIIGTTENYLSRLLWNARLKYDIVIEYNEKKFQKMDRLINSCGRHVALRLILKEFSLRAYQNFMERLKLQYDRPYDEIVTILTEPVLNDEMTSRDLYVLLKDMLLDQVR